jgi:nitrogenase-associated protein
MTHIVFYEKPGCGGNARQRAALEAAGHTLERRDLLGTPWTPAALLDFLSPLPVPDWFNRAAPRVKSGEIQPEMLDADQALALLLAEPLLIRRPLMRRPDTGSRLVGFDTAQVQAWVGLAPTGTARASLEGCAHPGESCATPPATPGA